MADKHCMLCGGSGKLLGGLTPCPKCSQKEERINLVFNEIPIQYQGVYFDKDFLPDGYAEGYGVYMEELLENIVNNFSMYQGNKLICCRPNCGKSVWAYTLYKELKSRSYNALPLKDIYEVRELLNGRGDLELAKQVSETKIAVIKLPRSLEAWMFDYMSTLVNRRVRSNGATIFLYDGQYSDIENQDVFDKMKYIRGNGSFNTIEVKTFTKKGKQK